MSEDQKEFLREFIEWAQENSPDAWWIYEHTEFAIQQFTDFKIAQG